MSGIYTTPDGQNVHGDGKPVGSPSGESELSPAPCSAGECEHDWQEEYYGTRCTKCNTFYPFGSEPWMPDDPALAQLQAIETNADDLLDAGVVPMRDVPKCVIFKCCYAPLVWMKAGESRQTQNGFLIAKLDAWYCPVCAGSYGGTNPPNSDYATGGSYIAGKDKLT